MLTALGHRLTTQFTCFTSTKVQILTLLKASARPLDTKRQRQSSES
jgi:hypothetical protein